jgi:DNA-binding HxlR family transcriptional regulator
MGDKWTALILLELSESESTFTQLETSLSGISPRTLSQRLDRLEHQEIIIKHQYCERPPRYRYQITKKARNYTAYCVKWPTGGRVTLKDQVGFLTI